MNIPDMTTCLSLLQQYGTLPNVLEHSLQVHKVARAIVDHLNGSVTINRDLVCAAALLHDITKSRALKTGEKHDISGKELLESLGYPEIADIVGQHVFLRDTSPTSPLNEADIVYYADKRVMHNEIVTVDQRIEDLLKRYGTTQERCNKILENKDIILIIEKKLTRHLVKPLEEIIASLKHE
ncbi:MAG TPA: HDIG domain-containing protein [Spirochaetota bacterium]|nr:HDIG domain-containing protein [Spirochaetota bacterium]HOM10546.1 HDIG domain-containing protein [Spirochaetota bacterium]HPP50343.1 HDIG domain-containing protein [Spirochaetota bacterium]HXK65824.1 HDIG domain-containing protein [Spirochaetota bacterium]